MRRTQVKLWLLQRPSRWTWPCGWIKSVFVGFDVLKTAWLHSSTLSCQSHGSPAPSPSTEMGVGGVVMRSGCDGADQVSCDLSSWSHGIRSSSFNTYTVKHLDALHLSRFPGLKVSDLNIKSLHPLWWRILQSVVILLRFPLCVIGWWHVATCCVVMSFVCLWGNKKIIYFLNVFIWRNQLQTLAVKQKLSASWTISFYCKNICK